MFNAMCQGSALWAKTQIRENEMDCKMKKQPPLKECGTWERRKERKGKNKEKKERREKKGKNLKERIKEKTNKQANKKQTKCRNN